MYAIRSYYAHQFTGRRIGGFSLTYSSVASILKYPYASGLKGKKKYGFFQSEKEMFTRVVNDLGLIEKEPGVYRITSYNVCYTKLLRNNFPTFLRTAA